MAVIPVNLCGDKILRKKTKKILKIDNTIIKLIKDMFDTMHHANGIGLAANQVGRDLALLIVDISKVEGYENVKPLVVINPKIKSFEGNEEFEEGCLSLPTIRAIVKRPKKIFLEYQDADLKIHHEHFDGLLARVLQHEIDHLNGILFIDLISKAEKKKYDETIQKIINRQIEVDYKVSQPSIL